MAPKSIIAFCFLLFGISNVVTAQFGFSHEIGVIAGPVAFQSDYGEDMTCQQTPAIQATELV